MSTNQISLNIKEKDNMEILTEWDALQEAMRKIDLSESTMPYVRGKLCESKAYNEMQKILAAPELIKSHNYILNLDPEQLSEDEISKVQKIYDLGVNRGFIEPSDDEADVGTPDADVSQDTAPVAPTTSQQSYPSLARVQNVPCWTVLYSACNADGDVKTGQCYSNSINIRSAKADCYAKLERCGYTNVKILAIEAGDPDSCGPADDEKECPIDKNADKLAASNADDIESITVTENDMLKRRPSNGKAQHNGHFTEADHSIDDLDDEHEEELNLRARIGGDEDYDAIMSNDEEFDFKQLFTEFITAADDFVKMESYHDADDPRLTDAFNDVKTAYEDAAAAADDQQLVELENEAKEHGLKVSDDGVTIVDIDKSEDVLDECGNPYAAGMKTVDAGGVKQVGTSAKRQSACKAASKKAMIDEDDEEDDSSDDSSSDDNTADDSSEDGNAEDTSSSDDASSDESSADEDKSSDDIEDDADDDSSDASDDEDTSSSSDESDDEDDTSSEDDEDTADDSEDTSDADDDSSDDASSEDDSDDADEDASDDEDDSIDNDDEESDDEDDDSDDEDDSIDNDDEESDDEDDDSDDEDDESGKDIIPAEDLTDEQKVDLKNEYKKTFKDIMMRCKFEESCFDDLSIKQKMRFFTKLNKAWRKNEPQDFMTDKEIEQLNKVVIKK